MKVVVCSTGTSNLFNVKNAIETLGHEVVVDTDGSSISKGSILIVPGVAAFGPVSQGLRINGQYESIMRHVGAGKKLIGLCLGAQLLLDDSEEDPEIEGFSLVAGSVKRLSSNGNPVPRQGWFKLDVISGSAYLQEFNDKYVYFSHSYSAIPKDEKVISATSDHGPQKIVSIFGKDNCVGIQFHPERSGKVGLEVLNSMIINDE